MKKEEKMIINLHINHHKNMEAVPLEKTNIRDARIRNELKQLPDNMFLISSDKNRIHITRGTHSILFSFLDDYPYSPPFVRILMFNVVSIMPWTPAATLLTTWNDFESQLGKPIETIIDLATKSASGFAFIPIEDL